MKTLSLFSTALIVTLLASPGFAVEGTRGGGKGVVCRDSQGKIKSVELLDLWEARTLYQRPTKLSNAPVAKQVQNALAGVGGAIDPLDEKSPQALANPYGPWSYQSQNNVQVFASRFLTKNDYIHRLKGVTLTLTDDSYEIAKPENCDLEQIVDFVDGAIDSIYVSEDLFNKMNATNQAALIVHEAIYRELRNFSKEPDSIRTRRAVGYIFSGQKLPRDQVPAVHVECSTSPSTGLTALLESSSVVDFYPDADGKKLQSIIRWNHGHQIVGYFPSQATSSILAMNAALKPMDVFAPDVCTHVTQAYDILWTGSGSPITYDTELLIQITCKDAKASYTLVNKPGPNGLQTDQLLTCKVLDNAAPVKK